MCGRRVELPVKEYELLRTLAREPTRVLTKVNFEPIRAEGRRARIQGLGGLVIPFPQTNIEVFLMDLANRKT
jgi:hypothetical protein